MRKIEAMDDARYQRIGQDWGSEDVALESSETSARWERDIVPLSTCSYGPEAKAEFEALRTGHAAARESRPEAVAIKTTAVAQRKEDITAAKGWVDTISPMIIRVARGDSTVASQFNAAYPADDSKLAAGIGALAKILTDIKDRIPASANVDARIAEAPGLQAKLEAATGVVSTAKAAPKADTAAIDVLDGRLYVMMGDFNAAARKAIRKGTLTADPKEYRFTYLTRRKSGSVKPPIVSGTTPPASDATPPASDIPT